MDPVNRPNLKSVALPVPDIIVIGVLDGGRVRRFLERGEKILPFPTGIDTSVARNLYILGTEASENN